VDADIKSTAKIAVLRTTDRIYQYQDFAVFLIPAHQIANYPWQVCGLMPNSWFSE
jgi:hypothetical protein